MGTNIIQIREATPQDAASLVRVHDEAWRCTYQGMIPHQHLMRMIASRGEAWWERAALKGGGLLVLSFDRQVRGYASFGGSRLPAVNMGEIFELYLEPTFQGLGFGRRLFFAARSALERQGLRNLIVWALAENEPACAFYVHLGGTACMSVPERFGSTTLTRVAYLWPVEIAQRLREHGGRWRRL